MSKLKPLHEYRRGESDAINDAANYRRERRGNQDERFHVLLIHDDKVERIYSCESRDEANAWVEEWDHDPLGIVAVVWPFWAPIPAVVEFASEEVRETA
jgi:hypothetical protein